MDVFDDLMDNRELLRAFKEHIISEPDREFVVTFRGDEYRIRSIAGDKFQVEPTDGSIGWENVEIIRRVLVTV